MEGRVTHVGSPIVERGWFNAIDLIHAFAATRLQPLKGHSLISSKAQNNGEALRLGE